MWTTSDRKHTWLGHLTVSKYLWIRCLVFSHLSLCYCDYVSNSCRFVFCTFKI